MTSFRVAADCDPGDASRRQELPPGVWREVLQHLSPLDQFMASMVCKAWRSHALSLLTPRLVVCLNSGAAASGFARWLAAHGHKVHSLLITEYYFSRNNAPFMPTVGPRMPRIRSRLGPLARVALWQGLHAGGRPLQHLHTLQVCLDDISVADAVAIGLCVVPCLTHLTLESDASAIGVVGAAGLVTLTSLQQLILPAQALGDQGLQLVAAHLTNLEALNVHNDGHVTDDGLAALAGLTALTRLDLQGNVSITQAAMPTLAAAAPRLRKLNLSWLAMVNDWGLGQLGSLVSMQDLNLRATGVQLENAFASSALQSFTALSHLDLSRCKVGPAGIAAIAASLQALEHLNLTENSGLRSFTELQPLQQLSSLTKLDLSSPVSIWNSPCDDVASVCTLTQLRHLALNKVISRNDMEAWLLPPQDRSTPGDPQGPVPADAMLAIIHRDLHEAAVPVAAQLSHLPAAAAALATDTGGRPAAGAAGEWLESNGSSELGTGATATAAAAAAAATGTGATATAAATAAAAAALTAGCDVASPWAHLLVSLGQMPHLTALEFAANDFSWQLEPADRVAPALLPPEQLSVTPRAAEAALLLLGAAAVQHSALRAVNFNSTLNSPASTEDTQQAVGGSGQELDGQWQKALKHVAATLLTALCGALGFSPELGSSAVVQHWVAKGSAAGRQQLVSLMQKVKLQLHGDESRPTAAAAGDGGCSVGSLPPGEQQLQQQQQHGLQGASAAGSSADARNRKLQRLQALVQRLHAAQRQGLLLPQADAEEVLNLLLPELRYLQFDW